jgi:hypothetical protein
VRHSWVSENLWRSNINRRRNPPGSAELWISADPLYGLFSQMPIPIPILPR